MPRVPRVLPREGLLQPLRVPALGLDAGPEAFGAGIARGGLAAGQVMSDIALDQKRDADASAVTEIADAAMKASINLLSNPETGLLNRKMKAAEGMTVEAAEQFTQIWKDAAAAAKNPSQRKVIEKMGYVQSLQDTRAVMVKEAEQIEIYKNESAKQHLATNADRVALTPLDDEVAQRAVADVRASTRARMTGKVTPEELAELERGAESVIHSSRISSLIASGRNSDAVELYGKVEGSLTAQAREHFGPTIRAASDLVKTQDVVGAVYAKYPDDPEAAFAEVRSTLSGKPEEEAISSLKVRYDERDSIRRERQSADLDAGYQAFVQTGRISAIPRDVYARLEKEQPQAILAMRNQAEADANRRSSITRAEMDVDAVGELAMMHPDILALPENDPRIKLAGKAPPEVILRYVEQRAAAIDRQRGVTRTGAAIKGPSVLNQRIARSICM